MTEDTFILKADNCYRHLTTRTTRATTWLAFDMHQGYAPKSYLVGQCCTVTSVLSCAFLCFFVFLRGSEKLGRDLGCVLSVPIQLEHRCCAVISEHRCRDDFFHLKCHFGASICHLRASVSFDQMNGRNIPPAVLKPHTEFSQLLHTHRTSSSDIESKSTTKIC